MFLTGLSINQESPITYDGESDETAYDDRILRLTKMEPPVEF